MSTSVLLLSLQLSFTNAVDVTRDVVVKNQTILNYLSNESITIAEGNSLQLFDGPDITLNGDLTIDGTLCVGSYTVPNLAITFDTGTVINHGNLFSWNTAATAGDTYIFSNLYNYGTMVMGSNMLLGLSAVVKVKGTFVNEGKIIVSSAMGLNFSDVASSVTNSGSIEIDGGFASINVPMTGGGCIFSAGEIAIDYSNPVDQTILILNGDGQPIQLTGLSAGGQIPKIRIPSGYKLPYFLMETAPTGNLTYDATTGILTYPPYQIDMGLGYPTAGWKLAFNRTMFNP